MTLLLLNVAFASPEMTLQTFVEWSEMAINEFELDDATPYRVVLAADDVIEYSARAEFGALYNERLLHRRPGRAEVVVGDLQLDSSRFRGAASRVGSVVSTPSYAADYVALGLQRDLWIATDRSFKSAVRQWQVKTAALAQLGEPYPADWTVAPPILSIDLADPSFDSGSLTDRARVASAALREIDGLRIGVAQARAESGHRVLATSEGTAIIQPTSAAVVYLWADVLTNEGLQLWEAKTWIGRTAADLPSAEEMAAVSRDLGGRVIARSKAKRVDYYEGPVVFEGEASADFFRFLLSSELEGTPPVPRGDRSYELMTRSGPRIGRRVLPAGWDVTDSPTSVDPTLAESHEYDREGVAAVDVDLVRDGHVTDLLMSRVPRKNLIASNGHARGAIGGSWRARLSNWEVSPQRLLSEVKFSAQVERIMRQGGLDRILVVRSMGRAKVGSLAGPTRAVWLYADGREEPVLALDFQKDDRRTLRDVVAAGGPMLSRPYLAPFSSRDSAPTSTGLPTVVTTPQMILVAEMEAVFPGSTKEPAVVGAPEL